MVAVKGRWSLPYLARFRRVKSSPDHDSFEKHRDTPPISIAILLEKKKNSSWQKVVCVHYQFLSQYASHLYRDTFAEVLGSGVVGTTLSCDPGRYLQECPGVQGPGLKRRQRVECFWALGSECPLLAAIVGELLL